MNLRPEFTVDAECKTSRRHIVKLEPEVTTKTRGGYEAVVTDITNRNTDQLDGYVVLPRGTRKVRWDFHGICRDNPPDLNLDMRLPEHAVLRQPLTRKSRSPL